MLPTNEARVDDQIVETKGFVYFAADPGMEDEPTVISADEADLREAIKCLSDGGLLSAGDQKKYREYIEPSMQKPLKQRLKAWRERNGPRK